MSDNILKQARLKIADRQSSTVTPVKRQRSFKNEMFNSLVWLYAKLINPLIILTFIAALAVIYWRVTAFDRLSIVGAVIVLAMLFLAINAVILLFYEPEYDGFEGLPMSRNDAPAIWAEIDRISRATDCPPITGLFVDNEFNASASSTKISRFSTKRELRITIGLPLMAALTPEECCTVVAHEIGHHVGDDSRRGIVIGRAFARASQIAELGEGTLWLICLPSNIIFSTYLHFLNKLSQKLRHQWEFDADAFAASVCNLEACGRAEVAVHLFADDIQEVLWHPVEMAYSNGTEIPDNLFEGMPERFSNALKSSGFRNKLDEMLTEESDLRASHPAMKDRLAHIGAKADLPAFDPSKVATKTWFPHSYASIAKRLQDEWLTDFQEQAGNAFLYARQLRARAERIFEETELVLKQTPDDLDANFARCALAGPILSEDEWEKLVRDTAKVCPGEPDIEYMLALYELAKDDPQGIERLFGLIENYAGGCAEKALESLTEMTFTRDDLAHDYPKLHAAYMNDELIELIADLQVSVPERQSEALAWQEWPVEVAVFQDWQKNAIIDFCDYQERIERLWIFSAITGKEEPVPRYFVIANYENDVHLEMIGGIQHFDTTEFPLRGICVSTSIVCGTGPIKGFMALMSMPKAVAAIIQHTEPIYQNGVTGRRLDDIKAAKAERVETNFDHVEKAA